MLEATNLASDGPSDRFLLDLCLPFSCTVIKDKCGLESILHRSPSLLRKELPIQLLVQMVDSLQILVLQDPPQLLSKGMVFCGLQPMAEHGSYD